MDIANRRTTGKEALEQDNKEKGIMANSTLDRITNIVKSNVNELLDHIEDPEKMVRQMVRDMDDAVDSAVASVCSAVANQRRLDCWVFAA